MVEWTGMDWTGKEWPDERGTIVGLLRSLTFTIAIVLMESWPRSYLYTVHNIVYDTWPKFRGQVMSAVTVSLGKCINKSNTEIECTIMVCAVCPLWQCAMVCVCVCVCMCVCVWCMCARVRECITCIIKSI